MATSRSEQLLRTTDLTLATYLIMEGFTPDGMQVVNQRQVRPGHPQGAWVFTETQTLRDVVEEFNDGNAQVEPNAFQEKLNQTRREMFNFLGIGNRSRQA